MKQETVSEQQDFIMVYFQYTHLNGQLREVSKLFYELANQVVQVIPRCPERTVALRKLLEGKDAAVRACLILV